MAGNRSKFSRLPPEIRELIGKLRTQRGCTIDEIHAKLTELDVEIGRSSVGRAIQKIDAVAESIQQSRSAAEAIMSRLGDQPESRVARLNIELMHSLLMKLMIGEDGVPVSLDAREAHFVSSSLQKLSSAAKTDQDRELKIREQLAKEMVGKLDEAEREATDAGEPGLSADRVAQLRRDFLGVRTAG